MAGYPTSLYQDGQFSVYLKSYVFTSTASPYYLSSDFCLGAAGHENSCPADQQYGNIYQEASTDIRWVGDLGEIVFNSWLKASGLTGFGWHQDNTAGKPDFTIRDQRIDAKTVKRKVPPQPHYTAQITAQHADHPIDLLFFLSYEIAIQQMWLLGGIKMTEFLSFATVYKGGEQVHTNYQIREGHTIYNAPISRLTPPGAWLEAIQKI